MPSKKQTRQQQVRRLAKLVEGDRARLGSIARGFIFWAAQLHLQSAESDPTADDLEDGITDGQGDLGVDAYYFDDEARTIYLFQGKYRDSAGTIKRDEITSFAESPRRLTDSQIIVTTHNEKIRDFAPAFQQKILDEYELNLVFLTTQSKTEPISKEVDRWNQTRLVLFVGGEEIEVQHQLQIRDADDLLELFDSASDYSTLELDLHLVEDRWHLAETTDGIRCLVATIEALELVDIFNRYKFRIFRDNPRGPLASAKVNKDIAETLRNPDNRRWFHLLNNGLSGVCEAFKKPELVDGVPVSHVTDLQIVNGCQTTYTLSEQARRGYDLTDAFVTLKLVETPRLQKEISKASNSQSQMKDWDFLFNDDVQIRLQRAFGQLVPPVFYELKRGEYRHMQSGDAQKVSIKDIAQVAWAFMGKPGDAKDKLRFVPRSKGAKSGSYSEVFYNNVTATHLWLCWRTYEKVREEHSKYVAETGQKGDFREHGRLYVVWLIGRAVCRLAESDSLRDIPTDRASDLIAEIDDWFPRLHHSAVETITYVTDLQRAVSKESGKDFSLRQLFRSPEFYGSFADRHDLELKRANPLPKLA